MHSMQQLVDYLNDYLAVQIWRPASDLVGNLFSAELDRMLRDVPLCNGLAWAHHDFERAPRRSCGRRQRRRGCLSRPSPQPPSCALTRKSPS